MRRLIYVLIMILGLSSCNNNSKTLHRDFIKSDTVKTINVDSFNKKILLANKKFKISDSQAIGLVQQVKEIKKIIDCKYQDTTVFNKIYIDNVPTESNENWLINLKQFQPKIEHSISLMKILVNAKTGNIRIWEVPNDTIISLETWLNLKSAK